MAVVRVQPSLLHPCEMSKDSRLQFKVSAALKTLLGRDLITNPNVAIFELVKNGYDAGARRVDICFAQNRIVIVDNGNGMSLDDIRNKWLFVAYSGKKDSLDSEGKSFAGSKGVGRFAADRLGTRLRMQTRKENGPITEVSVDWDRFDQSQTDHFGRIPIRARPSREFDVPIGIPEPESGTMLLIEGLRAEWNRKELLRLRAYLTRLVDPFEGRGVAALHLHAPAERTADADARKKARSKGITSPVDVVNGLVKSTLVDALTEGTTSVAVRLLPGGSEFETTLVDRGVTVYRLREPNPYSLLANSEFDCKLFYLRRAAKTVFARRMGMPSVKYGSIFLFKNGYRVFPIGEEQDDFFGIDRRKQQGYARYLGTRDLIGRLNVNGSSEDFRESTSRDAGLIETPAVLQMRDCMLRLAFRRLESFVVDVTWQDIADKDELDPSRLNTAEAKQRMVKLLAGLTENDGIRLIEIAPDLDSILAENLVDNEPSLKALEAIAANQKDEALLRAVRTAEARIKALVAERQQAQSRAESERTGREAAEAELSAVASALTEEKKRNLFLVAATPMDVQTLQGFLHQITLQATDIGTVTENALRTLDRAPFDKAGLRRFLERISWRALQTLAITRFATRANFRLETAQVVEDLSQFLKEYVERVATIWDDRIAVEVASDNVPVQRRFRPIDLSIVVDNLVSNARRANARMIRFSLSALLTKRGTGLEVRVTDDGDGLAPSIRDPESVFERGVTTTRGSGLGLWHVRHAMTESGGSVSIEVDDRRRLSFTLTFPA